MFFDIFDSLCKERGISRQRATEEIGLSNSTATKWKKTGATPDGKTLSKIADYFGVSIDFLLGNKKTPTPEGERLASDDDIKFALFKGDGEITDAMYEEVKNFAAYIKEREKNKKKE